MPGSELAADGIDWSLTTWDGSRREQLRRWAALPLERVILAIEEMEELGDLFGASRDATRSQASHSPLQIATLGIDELVDLLARDEDRVPRTLIDECVRRGEPMIGRLAMLLEEDRYWISGGAPGEWWLLVHAVMILGLMPSERAGSLLVSYMRRLANDNEDTPQDWLAGSWPAFFRNKPEAVEGVLRELSKDRDVDWYMRVQAVEALLTVGRNHGPDSLEAALDWAADIAVDKSEDRALRFLAGNCLLDFPRPRFRKLLEDLARQQSGLETIFTRKGIAQAYASPGDAPAGPNDDPWEFYLPENIAERQERWADMDGEGEEEEGEDEDETIYEDGAVAEDWTVMEPVMPYARKTAKIGRNDPCPCGSGKKYKKCCLAKDQA